MAQEQTFADPLTTALRQAIKAELAPVLDEIRNHLQSSPTPHVDREAVPAGTVGHPARQALDAGRPLRAAEAQFLLGIGRTKLGLLIRSGDLKPTRIGSHLRFPADQIRGLMSKGTR